jgi:hypothetical protein
MTRVPLRSVPTGPGVPHGSTEGDAGVDDVDIASGSMDADLELAVGAAAIGATAAVVASSLLDFLR